MICELVFVGALSQFAVNFGCKLAPLGPKKKEADDAVKKGTSLAFSW